MDTCNHLLQNLNKIPVCLDSVRWEVESKHIQSVPAEEEKIVRKEKIFVKYGRHHGQEKELKQMRNWKKNIFYLRLTTRQKCYRRHVGITGQCKGICCSDRSEIKITHQSELVGLLHKSSVWKLFPVKFRTKGGKLVIQKYAVLGQFSSIPIFLYFY